MGVGEVDNLRYRTASGSDRPSMKMSLRERRAGRYRSRFCNGGLKLASVSYVRNCLGGGGCCD